MVTEDRTIELGEAPTEESAAQRGRKREQECIGIVGMIEERSGTGKSTQIPWNAARFSSPGHTQDDFVFIDPKGVDVNEFDAPPIGFAAMLDKIEDLRDVMSGVEEMTADPYVSVINKHLKEQVEEDEE